MCTWIAEMAKVDGSAKGRNGWFAISDICASFDHPCHAPFDHTLNIDFVNRFAGADARVAVELTADSARALVRAILAALDSGELAHPQT